MIKINQTALVYLLSKNLKVKRPLFIFVAIYIAIFCCPFVTTHADYFPTSESDLTRIQKEVSFSLKQTPEIKKVFVTAYSSTVGETDDTPCISANGYDLCKHNSENVVACNFLPFGAKVIFPQLDPNKYYTVVDRMQNIFDDRIDIWKKTHKDAEKFGIKYLKVEIYRDNQ
ncbi:MAG: hypothetical protein PHC97_00280 [Patescibacteria group bacterium]|nr:hypothetical protein [Patescibacteria group bacterium]